jgi:hypothetical protein
MKKPFMEYLQPYLIAALMIASAWLLYSKEQADAKQQQVEERLDKVEKDICTPETMELIMVKVVDARFDKFEIYLQDKYFNPKYHSKNVTMNP